MVMLRKNTPQDDPELGNTHEFVSENQTYLYLSGSWGAATPNEQIFTVVHELAHTTESNAAATSHWLALSDWNKGGTPHSLVSDYAGTNPKEDWAESALYYRFAPEYLLKISPEKYRIQKLHSFHGQEFLDPKNCGGGPSFLDRGEILGPPEEKIEDKLKLEAASRCEYLFWQEMLELELAKRILQLRAS